MNTTTKVILGMAVAAAAGAAIGMLFAPEKGSDLQKKLAGGAKDWMSEIGSLLDLGKDVISKMKSQGGEVADELTTQMKEMSNN
ncbi:MAG TPA: YtxH domain-containing protein [Chryseolinea sp.]|nr:YtxH domain-containing protein [Chryseolinea sp.]